MNQFIESLGPFLTNAFGDRYLYSINRNAFDKTGSEALYHRLFGEDLFRENHLTVIIGTDSGLLPRYIRDRGVPEGSRFLFVELPEILDRLRGEGVLEDFGERIVFAKADDWLVRAEECRLTDYIFLGQVRSTRSLGVEDGNLPEYHDLSRYVRESLEQVYWERNAQLGNEAFLLKQIENLGENLWPASALRGKFAGYTAIVLGGGPSLDEVIPWLLENRENVVIFAVSRICRRLLEVGLEPHVVVSIDPHAVSFDVSKEMLRFGDRTLFVNHYHTVSSLLGQWRGRNVFLGQFLPWDSPLNRDTTSSPGPTVTNAAVAAAIEMGFSTILLAGVDLCFSRSGHTHARGSNEFQAGPQLGRGQSWVETNGGWQAETSHDFAAAVRQLGYQAREAAKLGTEVINLAEGAARISDVLYRRPEDVPLQPFVSPIWETFSGHLPEESSEVRYSHYCAVCEELNRAAVQLKKIRTLAAEALDANDGLFGRNGKTANFKFKKRMDKIEKRLNTEYGTFSVLAKKFGIRDFLKITRPDREREWSDEEIERTGRIYYEAYRNSAGRLLDLINEARERIEARLEEERPNPDWSKLIRQWRKDGQPGRALVWKRRHPEASALVPVEAANSFEELEREFEEILSQRETEHTRRTRKWSDLSTVRGKALTMFKRRQRDLLAQLTEGLAGIDRPEAFPLLHLCRGYLAELDEAPERAAEEYQTLLEEAPGPVLEDALRRIAALSLDAGALEDARLALECLTGFTPVYLPQYGDLLWLMGERPLALDTYADYLERVPGDTTAMLKLGRYYKILGVPEGARLMFAGVLEKDPENTAAKMLLAEVG